jgi:hypothetical protein
LATAIKPRRRIAAVARRKNGSNPHVAAEFAAGSLEAELSRIGKAGRPESGRKSPPITSPTSTTTSTVHQKRSEVGLRGNGRAALTRSAR